jgi:hypothetical protein
MSNLRLDITIKESLRQIVAEKYPDIQISRFDLTHPERLEHGDYATNVAMILAKQLQRKPSEVAHEIETIWNEQHQTDYIDHIEVTPSGYINFFLTKDFLLQELHTIVSDKESYGQGDGLKGQKILLEYGQPNTHKMPHIGHLFSYVYGESCAQNECLNVLMTREKLDVHVSRYCTKKHCPFPDPQIPLLCAPAGIFAILRSRFSASAGTLWLWDNFFSSDTVSHSGTWKIVSRAGPTCRSLTKARKTPKLPDAHLKEWPSMQDSPHDFFVHRTRWISSSR